MFVQCQSHFGGHACTRQANHPGRHHNKTLEWGPKVAAQPGHSQPAPSQQ